MTIRNVARSYIFFGLCFFDSFSVLFPRNPSGQAIDEKDQKSRPVVRLLNWVYRFIFNIGILYPNLILRKLFRPKNERISLFHDAS